MIFHLAQTFEQAKKKRAWSPLKTTRYGVSARRPKEESTGRRISVDHDSNRDAPSQGPGNLPTGLMKDVRSHHTTSHIRVEPVRGIVGELNQERGNKVFQVVTPAR